jgi:CRISPR-associated protein (TIGR02710 family)
MSKILLITVGGSHQPIVTSVRNLNPDRVIFISSGGTKGSQSQIIGEGKPCEVRKGTEVLEKLPNIPTQLNLGDKFNPNQDLVLVQNPDDLSECYRLISDKIRSLQQENPESEFLADYTGGTKTMSVALGMAGIDYKVTLYLTTSTTRPNLIKVERGERVRKATVSSVTVNRTIEQLLPTFLQNYNYPAAISELNHLLQTMELNSEDGQRVQDILDICTGFDLWDRFDHIEAWHYLQSYMNKTELRPMILFLKRVMGSRESFSPASEDSFQAPDKIRGHGYEIIEDLLLNAERRATLKRYDDAVARLYRALELLEQVRLWQEYEIKTGDLDIQKLPESLRPEYEVLRGDKGKIQLALTRGYILLSQFPNDPIGELYNQHKNTIQNALQIRNYSILAHGLEPVTEQDYQKRFYEIVKPFIESGIAAVSAKSSSLKSVQFPNSL